LSEWCLTDPSRLWLQPPTMVVSATDTTATNPHAAETNRAASGGNTVCDAGRGRQDVNHVVYLPGVSAARQRDRDRLLRRVDAIKGCDGFVVPTAARSFCCFSSQSKRGVGCSFCGQGTKLQHQGMEWLIANGHEHELRSVVASTQGQPQISREESCPEFV
jgi:hypothetical protein